MLPNWMTRLGVQLHTGRQTGTRTTVRRSVTICTLNEAGTTVSYHLKRSSARRTLALQVREEGLVVVQAPHHTPLSEVEGFIRRHLPWLRTRMQVAVQRRWSWHNGMALPWLGGHLILNWQEDDLVMPRAGVDSLQLGGAWPEVPARVRDWYRGQAAQILPARLVVQADRMGVSIPPLRLSDAQTRWGSLSVQGRMGLNWRLVMLSGELIDYVICHELAHLRQHNHSPAFWREVEALYPDYRSARGRLRREGAAAMALRFDPIGGDGHIPEP